MKSRRFLGVLIICCTAAATGLLLPSPAVGQTAQGEVSVQRFEPVPGPRNYLSVAGGRTNGEWTWSAGLLFDYARDPFVLRSCVSSTSCDDPNSIQADDISVVQDLFTWNLLASLTPIPRLQIGLRFPVIYAVGEGFDASTGIGQTEGLAAVAAGDPALEAKVRILGDPNDMLVLAGAFDISAPVGHAASEGSYVGNDSPVTVGGRAIVDFKVDGFSAAANIRGIYRQTATIGNTSVGSEFRYGVAAGYQINEMFKVLAEGFGSTLFSTRNGTNSLEVDGAIQIAPAPDDFPLVITLGGGAGVLQGIGVPLARGMAGLSYVVEPGDKDRDGIADSDDKCPSKAEDKDGLQDSDGCPEEDADYDKVADEADKCPLEPETYNGVEDDDGCPDTAPDSDGDGYPDPRDACPKEPGKHNRAPNVGCPDSDGDRVVDKIDQCQDQQEDMDGFADDDGCPDPDNDGDGVPDGQDRCPDEAEIINGFEDDDGCGDLAPDSDDDGLADAVDRCRDTPENLNGVEDNDGCKDTGFTLANVTSKAIWLNNKLEFEPNQEQITHGKSLTALRALAAGLKNYATILQVEVEVLTKDNDALARKRSFWIVDYLEKEGVAKGRLVARSAIGEGDKVSFKVLKLYKPKSRRPDDKTGPTKDVLDPDA